MLQPRCYFAAAIVAVFLASSVCQSGAPKDRSKSDSLRENIEAILERPPVADNKWSILIQDKRGKRTFFRENPDLPLKPASNIKLFTTACAYNRLGWNHKWHDRRIIEAIRPINKNSINWQADDLLRHIGRTLSRNETMWAGAKDVFEWCQNAGIDMSGAKMVDGSGLSHKNRLTAHQIISLLRYMLSHHEKWDDSLAVGGVDGTIRHRFRNTAAEKKVFAKTGTLTGVISLSGIVVSGDDEPVLFSFLANHVKNSSATRKAIDDCVSLFAELPTSQYAGLSGEAH